MEVRIIIRYLYPFVTFVVKPFSTAKDTMDFIKGHKGFIL
jgi:hypothetical protein